MKHIFLLPLLVFSFSIQAQFCDPNLHSLTFDGSSYIEVGPSNDLNITDEITVEAWIYATSFAPTYAEGAIVCKHGWTQGEKGYVLRAGGNGQLSFNIAGVNTNGNPTSWQEVVSDPGELPLNEWVHVAGTYDGNKIRIYINGDFVKSKTFNGSIDPSVNYNLKIGRTADMGAFNGRYWHGMIDEVRIWDDALSGSVIDSRKDIQIDPQNVNHLVAYWQFNEGTGTTTDDLGSGGITGTLHNSTFTTDVPFTNGISRPTISQAGSQLISNSLFGNQWNLNGVPITGANGITFTPLVNGDYSVTVNLGLGCIATSENFLVLFTAINNPSGNNLWTYYITNNELYFSSKPGNLTNSSLKIYDLNSRLILERRILPDQLNLQEISTGVYILCIQSDQSVFQSRFFIH